MSATSANSRRAGAAASPLAARIRAAAALGFAALAVSVAGSCTSVLSLDGYDSASGTLCDLLDLCYAEGSIEGCRGHVEAGFANGGTAGTTQWLAAFSDRNCLATCISARRCLDLPPVCEVSSCTRKEDCCGFVHGRSDCGSSGRCCRPRGVKCNDNSECCEGAGKCAAKSHTCGGTTCVENTEPCLISAECCSGVCSKGKCTDTICGDVGFECANDAECCNRFCDPKTGHCAVPVCGQEGYSCKAPGDPACCAGLACSSTVTGKGVCTKDGCSTTDVDCATGSQCCSHQCDPDYFKCTPPCADVGAMCKKPTDCCSRSCGMDGLCAAPCGGTGVACATGADCCSQQCDSGHCAAPCTKGGCGHGECTEGGPIDPSSCTGTFNGDKVDTNCVTQVCQSDPYCCCGAWDSLCVSEALALSLTCPSPCE